MIQYLLTNFFDPVRPLKTFIFSSQNVIFGAKNADQGPDTKSFDQSTNIHILSSTGHGQKFWFGADRRFYHHK